MDLVIEKDEHAAEVFEGQMGSAVHHLVEALGISDEVARLLTEGGMGDLATLATGVDMEDIAEVLGGDMTVAAEIYQKAKAHSSAPQAE
jgi:N utilization substance protein A